MADTDDAQAAKAQTKWIAIGSFLVGGIIGLSAGIAVGLFIFPYIFQPPPAMETVANRASKTVVAKATFIHANPSDPVHFGKGSATVFTDLVHLERNFEVGPGPKYHVFLSPKAEVKKTEDFDEAKSLDLGPIKSFMGSQNYPVPAGTDLASYKSIVIWCKAFGVLISPATLEFALK
jgi:hypothetical protein